MDSEHHPTFKSLEDELNYWKELAQIHFIEKEELQREFSDYTEQSQQLERELETSLEQAERANKTLEVEKHKLENEIETLKLRLEQSTREINSLQSEITTLKDDLNKKATYIRELEQKNDDLERAQRVVAESIAAAEMTLNSAIERNALLESEVDEKEQLKMKLQRLMDETRDLKQELHVRERTTIPDNDRGLSNGHIPQPIDSNRLVTDNEISSSNIINSPQSPPKRDPSLIGPQLTPSAKHSALNLVGDILRKMGSLEAKVAACRNRDYTQNIENRYRRLNRGTPNTNNTSVQSAVLH